MMDAYSNFSLFGDSAAMMLSFLIFLATSMLAFALMIGVRAREAVRRRVVRVGLDEDFLRRSAFAVLFRNSRPHRHLLITPRNITRQSMART